MRPDLSAKPGLLRSGGTSRGAASGSLTESDSLLLTDPDETVPDVSITIQPFGDGKQWIEERLQEPEARFRSMAGAALVPIWTSGTDKNCVYFNQPGPERSFSRSFGGFT
jgi:hypothetical protein